MEQVLKTIQVATVSTSVTVAGKRILDELSKKLGMRKGQVVERALRLLDQQVKNEEANCRNT